jgi:FtsP/CotA-like multicopper oxidase with cupredoxin domain
MRDLTASLLSPAGHLLARPAMQLPGTDTLVPAQSAGITAAASGPPIQAMRMAPTVAITPEQAAGQVGSASCKPLAPGHRRKILFGFPQPTTFGLGYVETDAAGNDIEATRIPIGEFNPAQTVVCVPLPGGQTVHEIWELQNLTDEDHNFHIHQTRFFLVAGGVAPGVTIPTLLNGSLVLHDNVPVPHPANPAPCSEGTLAAVKAGACKPSSTFVVIPFREIGDFVFHCHILEHEDGGMMARIRVVPAPQG